MKTQVHILILTALVMGACSSSYRAGVGSYDDLYYTPRDARIQNEAVQNQVRTQELTEQAVQQEELSEYEKYRLSMENEYINSEGDAGLTESFQQDTMYYDQNQDDAYVYYDDGSTPIVNNYYSDVYQYSSYTDRINRFHSPYYGYSYYDSYYNNSWYDPYYYSYPITVNKENNVYLFDFMVSIKRRFFASDLDESL